MAGEILRSIIEELQPLDVKNLQYVMRDNFTGSLSLLNPHSLLTYSSALASGSWR